MAPEARILRREREQLIGFLSGERQTRDHQSARGDTCLVVGFFGEMLDAARVVGGDGLRLRLVARLGRRRSEA